MPEGRNSRRASRRSSVRRGSSTRIKNTRSGLNPRSSTILPESPFFEKGLRLRQLIRGTPNLMRENSLIVNIINQRFVKTRSGLPAVHGRLLTKKPGKIIREVYIIGAQKLKDGSVSKKPINKHSKVIVSCTCLTGDTKVLTDKGWQTLYELAEPLKPDYFPINYNVNGKYYKGSHPFCQGKKKVWKLELSNGQSITGTSDHRLLQYNARDNYTFTEDWTEIKDLQVGDKLITNEFDSGEVERNEKFWHSFFLGVLMGGGTFNQSGMEICEKYHCINQQLVDIDTHEILLGYLTGLVATDGSVYKNGDIVIEGRKEYLEHLSWKLMEYGYTRIALCLKGGAGVFVNETDNIDAVSTKDIWSLRISGLSGILNKIPLIEIHKEVIKGYADREVIPSKPFVTIKSIEYAGEEMVYDLTVTDVHRFNANGIIAKNCENYMYVWEWANTYHGASRIIYGNRQPPYVTNPRYAYGLCKHAYKLALSLVKADR